MGLAYQGTWVINVTARLRIPDLLVDGPKTSAALAQAAGSDPSATFRLLRAAASMGLVEQVGRDTFALTPLGDCLRSDIHSMHGFAMSMGEPMHHRPFEKLLDAVKAGTPVADDVMGKPMFAYVDEHPEAGAALVEHMEELALLMMPLLLSRYDVTGLRRVVDVGGGMGFILAPILEAAEGASGVLFDRPAVVAQAKEYLTSRGVADRVEFVTGDFLKEDVPSGADAYVLKGIMHDHSDENSLRVLRNCRRAMRPDSKLLAIEGIIPSDRPGPTYAHWLDLAMLVLLGGRERTIEDFEALFETAGLRLERQVSVPIPYWPELFMMEVRPR
jgi:SAM-dependent methyltransferase